MTSAHSGGESGEFSIRQAGFSDIDRIVPLFDAYRCFYGQQSDLAGARQFIHDRLCNLQSVIFLAVDGAGEALGFIQLYKSFSSVSMRRIWILNDLYVVETARGLGVARALMLEARTFSIETEAKGLILATAHDNQPAKKLYESLGFVRDDEFYHYFLST